MASPAVNPALDALRTLPGDDVRQIMWRFADRYDVQMLVQSARQVARGPVARLVAAGGRNDHDWTPRKAELLAAYDASGITAAFMEPEEGGFISGPKNLALALAAFELAWVDAGAATGALAGFLGLSPIHEKGTPEQRRHYMSLAVPPKPGEERKTWRAAFALTEPIPYVGVDTGMLSGRIRVAEWQDGAEPVLQVEKRGRFITNMGFASFVTAAVDSGDPRIKGSCMVILEEGDPGTFDRGTPTRKLVHQLSSTTDPIFSLRVPASRIVGGYTVKDGVIVPNFDHSTIIEAVFRRTRVTVGVITAAKLLSAIEPVIRYQRNRFRGAEQAAPGSIRHDLGIQQREDALHRLVEVWATGEAAASLGLSTARLFDELDPLDRRKDALLAAQGIAGARATMKWMKLVERSALEYLDLAARPRGAADEARFRVLGADEMVRFALLDAQANVLCPATKLWDTGHGATVLREAVSLMGGYGITEDCPGFLGQKWMDSQLEATYEGPEAVQRRQLSVTMTAPLFLAQLRGWARELRHLASSHPGTGACALASAMELWLWTVTYLAGATDADGERLVQPARQGVSFKLADALAWLCASRAQILDAVALADGGAAALGDALPGTARFLADLCHVEAARAAGEVGRICAELVHGYNRHPAWDEEGRRACWSAVDAEALEGIVAGLAGCACDQVEGEHHPEKEGPCASCRGITDFARLRVKMDGCLTGAMLAKDRAAEALAHVMIPEALDYPA
ncbi:acyl-CoA dehydrogenase family protein [Anaeromyxobacter oryzisoli]|uniref:acyl-CoA dehydrogenase family protein n=1 Tax=Anaeromyxobacter oryzisoli TaxID=2925408 RepID=UPI001F56220E|nr:acyl-CoA dehydrogenase family protein [Anaeromyxobacter sp. SG63]